MSISDLYSTAFQERNRDHFAAIVRVALSDGEISKDEQEFLDRLARNLGIRGELYAEIMENPFNYPVNPPLSHESRVERLYDIARMVYVDEIKDDTEVRIMRRLCIGLGFKFEKVDHVLAKALKLAKDGATLDHFKDEFKYRKQTENG